MKLVSIIVPMYNESKMADDFFKLVNTHLDNIIKIKKDIDFEIIAVNDGSNDDTFEKLKFWHESNENIAVISLSRNFGQEAAIFAGLEKAQGDAIIVMDCDMQDPPEVIGEMIEKWEQGFDVVNIKRTSRDSDTKFKRDTAEIYYKLLNKLSYKVKYPINVNNFRLISAKVLDVILQMPEKNKFYRGLIPFAGFKTTEIYIERRERLKGDSKYNLKAMVKLASEGIAATTTKPLLFPLKVGLFFLIAGLVSAVILILLAVFNYNLNYTLFGILSGLAFFTGTVLAAIGLIGFYLAKAYEEIKGRPFNIVDTYLPSKKIKY